MKDPRIIEKPRLPEPDRGVSVPRERPAPTTTFQSVVMQAQAQQQGAQSQESSREQQERRESRGREQQPLPRRRDDKSAQTRETPGRTEARGESKRQDVGHARVVSKHDGKSDQRDEHSGQQKGGGRGDSQGRGPGTRVREAAVEKTAKAKQDANVAAVQVFAKQMQRAKDASQVPARFSPEQMQHVVNQLVAAFRKGTTSLGADTLMIGFSAQVFAGLSVQLTAKDGGVVIQWKSANPAVRALFEKEQAAICAALAKKDIAVAEYVVERTSA